MMRAAPGDNLRQNAELNARPLVVGSRKITTESRGLLTLRATILGSRKRSPWATSQRLPLHTHRSSSGVLYTHRYHKAYDILFALILRHEASECRPLVE